MFWKGSDAKYEEWNENLPSQKNNSPKSFFYLFLIITGEGVHELDKFNKPRSNTPKSTIKYRLGWIIR